MSPPVFRGPRYITPFTDRIADLRRYVDELVICLGDLHDLVNTRANPAYTYVVIARYRDKSYLLEERDRELRRCMMYTAMEKEARGFPSFAETATTWREPDCNLSCYTALATLYEFRDYIGLFTGNPLKRRELKHALATFDVLEFRRAIHHEWDLLHESDWYLRGTQRPSGPRRASHIAIANPLKIKGKQVLIDGEPVQLNLTSEKAEEALAFLARLCGEPGNWMSGPDIAKATNREGTRFDLVYKALPEAIKSVIQSDRRKGYRLRK